MRSLLRLAALAALVTLIGVLAGCGEDAEPERSEGEPPAPVETVDRPAPLPEDWRRVTNGSAGFTVGLPPGWREGAQKSAQGSVLTSPDALAAVTINVDRSAGALALEPEDFAARTAEALGGAEAGRGGLSDLRVGEPERIDHPYDAALVGATGVSSASGERERVEVAVLRRPELAVYVLIARSSAEAESQFTDPGIIAEIIASLRGRPAS